MFKFQDLFSSLKHSIRHQKIPLKDVVSEICAIGSFLPVYKRTQQPALREQLPKLQAAESIEDIMLIINDYCSFFNYEIIEHLILKLGTENEILRSISVISSTMQREKYLNVHLKWVHRLKTA